MVLLLANFTGWSLAEICDLDQEDLVKWVNLLPKEQ